MGLLPPVPEWQTRPPRGQFSTYHTSARIGQRDGGVQVGQHSPRWVGHAQSSQVTPLTQSAASLRRS